MHRDASRRIVLALVVVGTPITSCLDRPVAVVDPQPHSVVTEIVQQTALTKVDILFVVDNSGSMHEEQDILAAQIEVMARELVAPSEPAVGRAPPPVEDLHVGIITSDIGTGGHLVQHCDDPHQGDNGALQAFGRPERGGSFSMCEERYVAGDCSESSCPWLAHGGGAVDDGLAPEPTPIWQDFACIATLGTDGCGFEQPLEASLLALTTQAAPGRPNAGFLRDDSLLAVIYVTDEDDCSAADSALFDSARDEWGSVNTRCAIGGRALLHPVSRYVEGLRGLRPGAEGNVVVAAIAGVPIDGSWQAGEPIAELEALVAPANTATGLAPSCSTGLGLASPPVRLAELVYAFGGDGILESICRSDWTPALRAITRRIQEKLTGACLDREVASTDPESCRVVETLSDGRACPNVADVASETRSVGWQVDLGLDSEGRRQCLILPADYDGDGEVDLGSEASSLEGWFYLPHDPADEVAAACEHGQVRLSRAEIVEPLSTVRFECATALCPARRACLAAASEGAPCDPGVDGSCGEGHVCVAHASRTLCGGEPSCGRCSPAVGALCPAIADEWATAALEPLVEVGGCCRAGFHCEAGACVPDRATACD